MNQKKFWGEEREKQESEVCDVRQKKKEEEEQVREGKKGQPLNEWFMRINSGFGDTSVFSLAKTLLSFLLIYPITPH